MQTTLQTPVAPQLSASLKTWWKKQAYRNKAAEWALYFMFISGFLLWGVLAVPWQFERIALILHIIASLILFPLTVLPFWMSHRRLLKNSKKQILKLSGQILDALLIACALSGLFLLLIGNRGDDAGYLAYLTHLLTALFFTPIIMHHSARWSVLQPIWSAFKRLKS